MKLEGKVAIVTGAGAGIGEATARLFSIEGAKVVCNDISTSVSAVVRDIQSTGHECIYVIADVSDTSAAREIVDTTIDVYGKLNILVNNAGVVIPGSIDSTSPEDWDHTMAVNVRGPFLLSKYAIPHLKKTRGTIIHVASAVAHMGTKDRAAYTASKGAIVALTRAMAVDHQDDGIRVNCISPGTTDTQSLQERLAKLPDPAAAKQAFIERQPLKRLGTPEEIAEGILYLALADFCTGSCLSVDGGMSL
jgi:NAD(P)-dependent dehydrogenase (short-subunit alcohol dehydrogenase family)